MLGIMAVPSIAFYLLLHKIPESPRWLMQHHQVDKAKEVAHQLAIKIDFSKLVEQGNAGISLFQKKYAKLIFFAVMLAFFNQMTGINAILYYAPRIFDMAGFDQQLSYLQPIYIGGTNLFFTFIGMSIIDKLGRKKLLLAGAVGMFIFLLLTAFGLRDANNTYLLYYIIGFIACFALSQGAVIWVFLAEIFPNEIRAKGSSLGSTTHWVFAALISWVFPIVVEGIPDGGYYIFLFYAIMVVLSFLFILGLPETKGKSLDK